MKFKGKPLQIYETVTNHLESLDEDKEVVILISSKETKEIRSLEQNNLFWELFTDIGNHLGETKEDVRDILLAGVFGTKTMTLGKVIQEQNIEKHTSKLTKEQGTKFIDTILKFARRENIPITMDQKKLDSLYNSYKPINKPEHPMSELDNNF